MKDLKQIIAVCLILVITFVAFFPSLRNDFVNYDDIIYVASNPVVQSLTLENFHNVFTSFFLGHYQPLTILSFLFEYHLFKLNPFGYHLTNLILHLFNCLLVFWLVYILSRKISVSCITAILFGIHPLQVESVAWISGRKNMLYAFFFLGAMICYLYYLRKDKALKYYFFAIFLFVLSLLSKSMAVTLPLVFFVLDYSLDRKADKSIFIEKVPHFILSLVFGIIAVFGVYISGAIRQQGSCSLLNKLMVASHGIVFYLEKIFLPVRLSALYSYSAIKNTTLYLYPLVLMAILLAGFIFFRTRKKFILGAALFLITILPALQFVPNGEIVVADRYIYLSSIGIFYILAEGFIWLSARRTKLYCLKQTLFLIIIAGTICFLGALTWKRCAVWKDSLTLWNDVLEKYPNAIMAYNNRAVTFFERKEYEKSISDFKHVIGFVSDGDKITIYRYLSYIYRLIGNNEEANLFYNREKEARRKLIQQYYQAGNKCLEAVKSREAIKLYQGALALDPGNLILSDALAKAYLIAGRYNEAEVLYKRELDLNPQIVAAYNNLALVYYYKKQYDLAVRYCNKAIEFGYKVEPRLLYLLKSYRTR